MPLVVEIERDNMNTNEKIDEMCRQWLTTKPCSKQKKRDLWRGIARAEKKRRKEKLKAEGTIFI